MRTLKMVADLHEPDVEGKDTNGPERLIWLDTLCCPAKDSPGNTKAIEKIRLVYKQAEHALVLDSSIMAYQSNKLSVAEQQIRIFTSRWMRRLWTLQEAALATSLYFQFAEKAIVLKCLKDS